MRTGGRQRKDGIAAPARALRSAERRPPATPGDAFAARRRELEAHYLASGGPATLEYLHQHLTVKQAAVFLGTTQGQLYNLMWRYEIPFIQWGKCGKRFCRLDLIAWQEIRVHPSIG